MWLIRCNTLQLYDFFGDETPPYAILSHTWQEDEVTFAEFRSGAPVRGADTDALTQGWKKIMRTCELAIAQGYDYAWIDTCCIDKSSSAELTEAINSMYSWYAGSSMCFTYLSDFDASTSIEHFTSSRWFTRGWTLQELIAPENLVFYDASWNLYDSKASLCKVIARTTGIDEKILCATGDTLRNLLDATPICQRMSWAAHRETRRPEDTAYALLGIFGIYMSLIYGEVANAFLRLQKKIMKASSDMSILAWKDPSEKNHPRVLASHPKYFADARNIVLSQSIIYNPDFSVSNKGISITVGLLKETELELPPVLNIHCHYRDRPRGSLGIYLIEMGAGLYTRAFSNVLYDEIAKRKEDEALIYLSTQAQPTYFSTMSFDRGHHIYFKACWLDRQDFYLHMVLMSTFPERRWQQNQGYAAEDTFTFLGANKYEFTWDSGTMNVVIACGFDPDHEPWACIQPEGTDLWMAATYHDDIFLGRCAKKERHDELILDKTISLTVDILDPPESGDGSGWKWLLINAVRDGVAVR
ncbi:heterokaryon incompatibility protein-domain-containing protein [Astrocystis sublimbata]|nr:heterokaryon incompatibility protein-domain-containing protein [Astrocystis sublimbata]